jgi:trans-AT polyketide synthase, acyltransferase and oxidoreductase domains
VNPRVCAEPQRAWPETLGSAAFRRDHRVRLAYMAGAMANGIASEALVLAMTRAGLLSSFGAAGLPITEVIGAVDRITAVAPAASFAVNLIHQPGRPDQEMALVDGLLERRVEAIEASAFMELSPAVVRFRAAGFADASPTRVLVKLSHPAVAEAYMRPPPADLLSRLVNEGAIGPRQADAAAENPVATDVTIEADSGGHTDRRPLTTLFPLIARLRARITEEVPAAGMVRLGAAGGLGTPDALAAAFALGADYVVTGSINQATREAATSALAKRLLADARIDETAMAPAADMFEIGAEVQVLRRGTMFAQRARRLRQLYLSNASLGDLSSDDRTWLEAQVFRQPIAVVRAEVEAFFRDRDPAQLERLQSDPKAEMALVFRWYLGLSSDWARVGAAERQADLQIWCGPAMGAFNAWVDGSRWAAPEARSVVEIADLLMMGAALHLGRTRAADNPLAPAPVDVEAAAAFEAEHRPPCQMVTAVGTVPVIAATSPATRQACRTSADGTGASAPQSEPWSDGEQAGNPPWTNESIEAFLIAEIALQLGVPETEIDPEEPFEATALDSARAAVIVGRLERALGRRLSPTLVWNYPTPQKLARRLATQSG